jgi:hypothetical protein
MFHRPAFFFIFITYLFLPSYVFAASSTPTTSPVSSYVQPMSLISRNVPAYASSSANGNDASKANNANDGDFWEAATTASWLAYDLSGVPTQKRKHVVLAWWVLWKELYERFGYAEGTPNAYTIEVNAASGGTGIAPTTGWQVVATIDTNIFGMRIHEFDMSGYNWVRINIKSVRPTLTTGVHLDMDIYDAVNGNSDSWLFLGDSITWISWANEHFVGGPFQKISTLYPEYYALNTNGGMGGAGLQDLVDNIDAILDAHPVRFYTISHGTNGSSDPAVYYNQLETVVKKIIAKGKVPIVPTLIGSPGNAAKGPAMNAKIYELYQNYPQVIPGPDLWSIFKDHSEWFSDPVHPNNTGIDVYRRTWETWMIQNMYKRQTNVSITPLLSEGIKAGDGNTDGKVDGIDYIIWLSHYNTTASGVANGDYDNNGKVDGVDYIVWLTNYGK